MVDGQWVSLYSGGKDSAWALYRALESGLDVGRLLTVHPTEDSYLYHVPATHLAGLAAESIDIPLVEVEETRGTGHESTARGDTELEALESGLEDLDSTLAGGVAGVIAGAVESEYQAGRLQDMCERLGIDLYAPLWHEDPVELAESMIEAEFDVRIVQVAARGLDSSWLGRRSKTSEICTRNSASTSWARAASSKPSSWTVPTWPDRSSSSRPSFGTEPEATWKSTTPGSGKVDYDRPSPTQTTDVAVADYPSFEIEVWAPMRAPEKSMFSR